MALPKLRLDPKQQWRAIAAMSKNRVIGYQNTIPWHYSEDFKYFKRQTLGATMLMGSKTWESIGRPLPRRTTVVLSRQPRPEDLPAEVHWIHQIEELEPLGTPGPIWLCGGAQLYASALHLCEDLLLTIIDDPCDGDAFFPEFDHIFPDSELLAESGPLRFMRFFRKR